MKKYIKNSLFLFLLMVLTVAAGYGQAPVSSVMTDVQSSFNQYTSNALQEKLFVHTDKNAYTTGELMWFKIYDVDGIYQKPLAISKVAYVEVLDHENNVILQAKIAMKNGMGDGSIYLPVTMSSGNFLLRAYTSWMKNFDPEYYFSKQLTIINPLKSPDTETKAANDDYDIQFFPEGGNLVNGIYSVVAFKGTNQWGKGISFAGAVLDDKNDTIVKFAPLKFGMGHFLFKPDINIKYRAIINIGGIIIKKELPVINNNGYVMNLTDNGNGQLRVTVNSNTPTGHIYLFAHTRNVIKVIETADMSNGTALFTFDKDRLGDGISHITIFNNDRQPVCERLYFKRPEKNLAIEARTDQQAYQTRKKVDIDIDTKNQNNEPVAANLSLSVYRVDSLQNISSQDIRNYLWLSSDLRGNIESPGYYFKDTDKVADEAADNLMLTQGWRRFEWSDILKNKMPAFKFLPEFNGPIVTAQIFDQTTNKPAKNMIAYLGIPGKRVQMYASKSDSAGMLLFNMKDFYGPGEVVVQTNTQVDTNYRIDILNPFSEQYADIILPEFTISPEVRETMKNHSLAMQIQNIYNGNEMRQFYDPQIDSSAFYGTPDKTYLLDDYTRFTTIEEIMREYVSEVNIINSKGHFTIKVLGDNGFLNEANPLVMIDGIPFFNIDKVFEADPLKIYKLDVVPYTYYWGPSVEGGIFNFTTYKGDLGGNEIDPHAVILDYDGLELQRVFYSPAYDTDKAYSSPVPDFRNVLYWDPNIITSPGEKNKISFYTSDMTGDFIGVIQGITANGEAGSTYFRFDVTK